MWEAKRSQRIGRAAAGAPGSEFGPGAAVGPYRIDRVIGSGACSTVYRATCIETKRSVALKVLRRLLTASPQMMERFRLEVEAIRLIRHPADHPVTGWKPALRADGVRATAEADAALKS